MGAVHQVLHTNHTVSPPCHTRGLARLPAQPELLAATDCSLHPGHPRPLEMPNLNPHVMASFCAHQQPRPQSHPALLLRNGRHSS
ncbi:hypothetical protein BGZ61DRAFT_449783, partial [Ilyonectria robusta]|uniref:uncharacterized protein n=1 Tax=Ilyonectria robusta TaxID=1079257 RepID=UPI001E8E77A4